MINEVYRVEGMDCGSCAKSIEKHLRTMPDIIDVEVHFSTGKMKVVHHTSSQRIIKEVSKLGYAASLPSQYKGNPDGAARLSTQVALLSGLFLALGLAGQYLGFAHPVLIMLYAISMIIAGWKPLKSAFFALKSRALDMNVLMTAAAIGAALIGQWSEGATVLWLFAIGNMLQTKSLERTRKSIRGLMDLAPSEAWLQTSEGIVKKPVKQVTVGDIVIVKPGERIPLDGILVEGITSVNQSQITGESIPVDKSTGDTVYAGSVNESGSIRIKITKLVEDTAIAKMIHMVEEAQERKAPAEHFVDAFAKIYTPAVFAIAVAAALLPPLFRFGSWTDWLYRGLELIVIACPCALVISTPVAIVAAIGNAAKNGVLIKGGAYLEMAGALDTIAFDKTGTLTEGRPKVSKVKAMGISERELLEIASTIEEHSTHPIAAAVTRHTAENGIKQLVGEHYKTIPGKGAQAFIAGKSYYAGSVNWFHEMGIDLAPLDREIEDSKRKGEGIVLIGTGEKAVGLVGVSDVIRESTHKTLQHLKQNSGVKTVMLTGDHQGAARHIAAQASVDRYYSDLLPEQKVEAIRMLQQEGRTVAMVGDGINDAPALAAANLGIAMGGAGTASAIETADIVLMADNLEQLPFTINLSRKALRVIKQNIWFSIIVKVIALALIFPNWLTLWMAVMSDTGASLLVILNSIRLLKK